MILELESGLNVNIDLMAIGVLGLCYDLPGQYHDAMRCGMLPSPIMEHVKQELRVKEDGRIPGHEVDEIMHELAIEMLRLMDIEIKKNQKGKS